MLRFFCRILKGETDFFFGVCVYTLSVCYLNSYDKLIGLSVIYLSTSKLRIFFFSDIKTQERKSRICSLGTTEI